MEKGEDLNSVITKFNNDIRKAVYVVGHNVSFDVNVESAECVRLGMEDLFSTKTILCTMRASTYYCRIPGHHGYKWPKLDELYLKLFGEHFCDAHNSLADVQATYACFWKLKDLNIM